MRILIIVLLLLALALGVALYLGVVERPGATLQLSSRLYDTDADGRADLVVRNVAGQGNLWRWDRDGDGVAELIAYDSVEADGGTRPTGTVTAWDLGGDDILDEGSVPRAFLDLLRSEAYAQASDAAVPGTVELVDMDIRAFANEIRDRFDAWRLDGFQMPILGASLPDVDRLLPGAPRTYRFGVHQGFDMYPGHIGVPTGFGGPVIAAKDGVVVRADVSYEELSSDGYDEAIATSRAAGTTPPRELDLLRGRQVWVDHGHGVVSRYAHLSGVAPGISEGVQVKAGAVIGFVGNSGTADGARGNQNGAHLHFELRIDDRYFGEGLPAAEIRRLGVTVFALPQPE